MALAHGLTLIGPPQSQQLQCLPVTLNLKANLEAVMPKRSNLVVVNHAVSAGAAVVLAHGKKVLSLYIVKATLFSLLGGSKIFQVPLMSQCIAALEFNAMWY